MNKIKIEIDNKKISVYSKKILSKDFRKNLERLTTSGHSKVTFLNQPSSFAKFGKGCLLFFSQRKGKTIKKDQKDTQTLPGKFEFPQGHAKGQKTGFTSGGYFPSVQCP